MRLPTLLAVAAATLAAAPAAHADTVTIPPIAKVWKAGQAAPVAFQKVESGEGGSRALRKGARLAQNATVQLVVLKGDDVFPPRDCGCQALGFQQPDGQFLRSAVAKAVAPSGKVIATAPRSGIFLEGTGRGLPIGWTYTWAKGVRSFPEGTKIRLYAYYRA